MMYGGTAKQQLEYREQQDQREHERWEKQQLEEETEQKIIAHTELATKTKAVYADGELHYIPIDEAKRLGLVA